MRPSPAQMVYIDSLYETLGVPFTKRRRAQTMHEASTIINDLKLDVEAMKDKAFKEEETF